MLAGYLRVPCGTLRTQVRLAWMAKRCRWGVCCLQLTAYMGWDFWQHLCVRKPLCSSQRHSTDLCKAVTALSAALQTPGMMSPAQHSPAGASPAVQSPARSNNASPARSHSHLRHPSALHSLQDLGHLAAEASLHFAGLQGAHLPQQGQDVQSLKASAAPSPRPGPIVSGKPPTSKRHRQRGQR